MSLVKHALVIEIRKHIENAVMLNRKIASAKTDTKKNVYMKKLKKNNTEAADLFIALNKLTQKDEAASGVKNEVPVLEGRTQETDGDQSSME